MNITNEQLISLVEGAKQKDSKSIEFLYNEFYGEIYYICYKILGNSEDAKDIAQETFLEAFVSIENLKEPLSYKYWLGRIASNKSLNYLKHCNRLNIQNVDFSEQLSDIEDIQPQPEEVIIESDVKDILESIMNRLPEEQRRTLFLFYYQEMTIKEIAELYGCSESTVKSRLAYARKFMRKEVEKMEDNGYKLRCLTALPFIFALFRAEQSTTVAVGQGNIINELNTYIASVPNSPQFGNSMPSSFVAKSGAKAMSGTVKAIIITASASVVVAGAIWAGVAISHNNNIQTQQNSQNSIVSQITDENSSVSKADVSTEENISANPNNTSIEWNYRKVENPTFNDSTYTAVMPYKNKKDLPDESFRNKKENLVNPSFIIDMDKAKKIIRANPIITNEFELADVTAEQQYPITENNITIYEFENEIAGFKKDGEVDKTYTYDRDIYLKAKQTYSGYTAPNGYRFHIKTKTMSQNDIFNIVKDIFGEKIAEWAVYSQADTETEDDENKYSVEINTPNGKGKYTLERTVSQDEEEKSLCFDFSIDFKDSNTALGDTGSYHSRGYDAGYKPIKTNFSLSNMLSADVGGTDLYNPDEFFDKAIVSTSDNPFVKTMLKDIFIENIKYEDGSEYERYRIQGGPGVDINGTTTLLIDDEFEFYIGIMKNKDGSISIESFDLTLPTGKISKDDDELELKEEDKQKLLSFGIKKVNQIFGIPESKLKDELIHHNIYAMLSYTKEVDIKLFGQTVTAGITFDVYEIGLSKVSIEYPNYL